MFDLARDPFPPLGRTTVPVHADVYDLLHHRGGVAAHCPRLGGRGAWAAGGSRLMDRARSRSSSFHDAILGSTISSVILAPMKTMETRRPPSWIVKLAV
jgi:hypothetical protein